MKVFIVNGYCGSGKTEFEQFIIKHSPKNQAFAFSSIDYVKEIAKDCGWNGTKTPNDRAFLAGLKQLLKKWNDSPYQDVLRRIDEVQFERGLYGLSSDEVIIMVDCREPDEIERFCKDINAESVFVTRPGVNGEGQTNSSDLNVENYNYDIVVNNNGDLLHLELLACEFLRSHNLPCVNL